MLSFRVTKEQQFTITGLDFAGPLYAKENGIMHKTFVAVYTCTASRAVHLHAAPDLIAEALFETFVDLLLVVDCLANGIQRKGRL